MERMRAEDQQKNQQNVSTYVEEIAQLKATIHVLRNELEGQKANFDTALQESQAATRAETKQLQLTIVELRDQIERLNGRAG
jgi:chromosome segregation ATPase